MACPRSHSKFASELGLNQTLSTPAQSLCLDRPCLCRGALFTAHLHTHESCSCGAELLWENGQIPCQSHCSHLTPSWHITDLPLGHYCRSLGLLTLSSQKHSENQPFFSLDLHREAKQIKVLRQRLNLVLLAQSSRRARSDASTSAHDCNPIFQMKEERLREGW